jgi:hypothetical protein
MNNKTSPATSASTSAHPQPDADASDTGVAVARGFRAPPARLPQAKQQRRAWTTRLEVVPTELATGIAIAVSI